MKITFIIGILFSISIWAQTDCSSCLVQTTKTEAEKLAEEVMNRDNNKCPKRTYPNYLAGAETVEDVKRITSEKIKELGLNPDWGAGTGNFSSWEAFSNSDQNDLRMLKQISNAIIYALSIYPKDAFKKMGLENVRIVKKLTISPKNQSPQHRMGMPDPKNKAILYSPVANHICEAKVEHTIHHELFHLIEGTVHKNMYKRDPKWQGYNIKGFSYGTGGSASYSIGNFRNKEHPLEGFVTEYATFGEEEDRSDVFAHLMTAGYAARLNGWSTVDPKLTQKRKYIIDFLKTNVSTNMNESYFNNLISQ